MMLLHGGSSAYRAVGQRDLRARGVWLRLIIILLAIALGKPAGGALAVPERPRIVAPGLAPTLRNYRPLQNTHSVLRQRSTAIDEYLPRSLPLPSAACFRIEGGEIYDLASVSARFSNVPNAAFTIQALGWQAGANRRFACDTPPPGSVGWVDVSVHRFADARSADAAVPFFASSRALGTSLAPATADELGSANAALTGDAGNGTEYTLYTTQGPLLFRVTGVAPSGNPRADVELVAAGLVVGSLILEGADSAPAFPQPAGAAYSIVDLGTGYGNWGSARLINDRGDVVLVTGRANYAESNLFPDHITEGRTYLWRDGQTVDLTAVGLEFVRDLNDEGRVLGSNGNLNLVLNTATLEPELAPGFENNAFPAAINNNGTIVGNADGVTLLMGPGNSIPIPMPAGYGLMLAGAVNDVDQVVGVVMPGPGDDADQRGFLYQGGAMILLGVAPGASSSRLNDVNDLGQAIGGPGVRGMHDVLQSGRALSVDPATGVTMDLGTLPGYQNSNALALNNQGQAVGIAWLPVDETDVIRRAVVFDTRTGDIIDLNLAIPQGSGWWLSDAYDINDAGQIVGRGYLNGESHAFLLTPQ